MRRNAALAFAAFLAAFAALFLTASPALAQGSGEVVQGVVRNDGEPVQGVQITVTREGGEEVTTATTDADGRWRAELPGPATYQVTLVEDSLPEGVTLRNPERATLTLPFSKGQSRAALFPLGESDRVIISRTDRAIQLAFDGFNFGLIIAMAAVGLSLIFGTTGLTNFAHAELVTLGGLVTYFFNVTLGLPLVLAGIVGIVVCAALGGYFQDRGFWGPLRRRGTGLIQMMVISIGLSIFARYFFLYIFGGSTRSYSEYQAQPGIDLGLVSATPKALVSIAISVLVLLAVGFALLRTRIGKATRAVADNPALAASSGIDVERVIRVVWTAGAGLAALGGILLGVAQQVSFQMGFQILLIIFAGVTLGGLGTAFGALVGSIVVGVFIQVSTVVIPPELKNAGALAILILILLVRPQGLLGRRERVG